MPKNTHPVFDYATDADLEDRVFATGRSFQEASELEVLDDLVVRRVDAARRPADAERALLLAKWRVISVFKDSEGDRRTKAVELVEHLNDALALLNALSEGSEA